MIVWPLRASFYTCNMSGFEIVGVVLGSIPLLISGLENVC